MGFGMRVASQAGFTLVELLVVMVIVVILMAIGAPSYRYVTTANRVSTEANTLLGDLQYARSEAVREGQPVTVCISKTGTSCDAASTSWQEGWIVFSDLNGNQTVDTGTPSDTVLRVRNAFSSTDTYSSSNSDYGVTFTRDGFAQNLGSAGLTVTLHDSSSSQNYTRCLDISTAGMMSVQTHSSDSTCQ